MGGSFGGEYLGDSGRGNTMSYEEKQKGERDIRRDIIMSLRKGGGETMGDAKMRPSATFELESSNRKKRKKKKKKAPPMDEGLKKKSLRGS